MAKWTIANLSDLHMPFLTLDYEDLGPGPGFRWIIGSASDYEGSWPGYAADKLESLLALYKSWERVHDPLGLLDGAKVVSVLSVYHAMELGRINV